MIVVNYASWCNLYKLSNYTAWKWQPEKKNIYTYIDCRSTSGWGSIGSFNALSDIKLQVNIVSESTLDTLIAVSATSEINIAVTVILASFGAA